ncbi:hypothetical protein A9Q92_03160 [Methylophaga sp. 42_8_T64]|nr:hypothetical protein A9Q78_01265 [Methylophaga sp. 41_12_T18]OUR88193.1 hypothetical protein A9Q92_03160 [Methylophaga sp. 42_8_T64]
MARKLERINSVCEQNKRLNKLTHRVQKLNQLNIVMQQALPIQFASHCHLANVTATHIIIHTDNASYASLLRFQAPVLCKTLSEYLPHAIDKLEVKVRPKNAPLVQPTSANITLPGKAAESLQQTADSLEDGALKTALAKLAQRSSKSN